MRLVPLLILLGCAHRSPAPAVAEATSSEAPAPTEAAAPELVERPLLLWQVEKDGATSHLMGTCHLPLPLDAMLPPPHDQALTTARVLVTEAAMPDPAGALSLTWSQTSLRERIGDEGWRRALALAPATLPATVLDRFQPWAVYGLAQSARMAGAGSSDQPTLDVAVAQRVAGTAVLHRTLETAEEQIEMLGAMNDAFVELLAADAETDAALQEMQADLVAVCTRGELEGFEAKMEAYGESELMRPVFELRNEAWMGALVPELTEGGAFVAVGAGHMLGGVGLLALLEARGFTITRLSGLAPVLSVPAPPDPPAPVDVERVEPWREALATGMPSTLCVPGNPIHDCFLPDAEACTARIAHDVSSCVDQMADALPTPEGQQLSPELGQEFAGCALSGVLFEQLVEERPPRAPVCDQMLGPIKAAFGR